MIWDLHAAKIAASMTSSTTVWSLDYSAVRICVVTAWALCFDCSCFQCGKLLSSGHADGTVKLWDSDMSRADVDGSRLLQSFATRSTVITSVAFTHMNLLTAAAS